MLTMGELFAGYGGLGMAVEEALGPIERRWVSEFDPAPSAILAHHWPGVPNFGDVTRIDWAAVPRVDILTGGFPCQDVSTAGARAGLRDGTRSGLWSHFAAAIAALRPRLVVIENVRGLLSAEAGHDDADLECDPWGMGDGGARPLRALGAVLGDLAGLGFDAEWGLLEAAHVGAPHHRARVFIIAWPADAGLVGGVRALMPTPEAALGSRGGPSDPAQRREGGHSVSLADAMLELLPTATVNRRSNRSASPGAALRPSLHQIGELLPTATVGDASMSGGSSLDYVTLTDAVIGRRGLVHGAAPSLTHSWGKYHPAIDRWEGLMGRPAPAPIGVGARGGRALSSRFVEWHMGLSEGHVTGAGLSHRAELKALGNGVVPRQGATAIRLLLQRAAQNATEEMKHVA